MSSSPSLPYGEAQRRAAAEWFVLIRSEDVPEPGTLYAWLRWMEASDGNRLAFEAVARAWHATPAAALRSLPTERELAQDDYDGDCPIEAWRASRARGRGAPAPASRWRAVSKRFAAAAAALLAVAVLALSLAGRYSRPDPATPGEFITRTGEQLDLTLADGSRVWLGASSMLLVAFDDAGRNVRLESGEAYFSVKKDRLRPFRVQAPAGTITAVGTTFDVRASTDRVIVAVTEGTVSVAAKAPASSRQAPEVRVTSGHQITIEARKPIAAQAVTASPSPGERARWREGVLVYRDEPLRNVIADVARYSERPIDLVDDVAGEMHFSGVVYRDAIEEWAAALPESFPVTLEASGGRLVIRAR